LTSTNKSQQGGTKHQWAPIEQNEDIPTNTNRPQQGHVEKHQKSTTRMYQWTPTKHKEIIQAMSKERAQDYNN
jgi:hypothetical protein